jgi:hypothetical protein
VIPVAPVLLGAAALATLGILAMSKRPSDPAYQRPTTPNGLYTGPDWQGGEALWPGCDVSHYQRPDLLDWGQAREQDGILWGMVRGAYGSSPDREAPLHVGRMRDGGVLPGLYFFPTEAPLEDMWREVKAQSVSCDIGPGDIAPAFDLEWLDGKGKLPVNREQYLANIEELLRRSRDTWGNAWIYTAIGYWQQMGSPKSWLEWDWWKAQYMKNPPPDEPVRWSAWQKGTIKPAWSRAGEIDFNLARFLPLVQQKGVSV